MEKICLKAPSYNSPPIWTYTFSICLYENPQTPHFYDFRIFERVPEPQNQHYLSFETPGYFNHFKQKPNHFWNNIIVGNLGMLEKMGATKAQRPVLWILENLGYGINIFLETWNGNLAICWNREEKPYNHKTTKPYKHKTIKQWNHKTNKKARKPTIKKP